MNTNIRRKDRAIEDKTQIENIVKQAKVLHLGLLDNGCPYIVPLHYGYVYDEQADSYVFYMHSAKEGHKLDILAADPRCCVELETDVALASGGADPCRYGAFYASFIGQGRACIVSDTAEKQQALALLMHNQTGKAFDFTKQMTQAVTVIKVQVTQYTAKARKKA